MTGRPELPIKFCGPIADHARRLRQLRDTAGLTTRRLAEKSGLSPSTVSEALNGGKLPSWATTSKIVTACDANPAAWHQQWKDTEYAARAPKSTESTGMVLEDVGEMRERMRRRSSLGWGLPPGPPPVPLNADTPQLFAACLRRVKIWAGDPPFRELESRSGVPSSTLHNLLRHDNPKLPKWESVYAFLRVCGVDDASVIEEWRFIWRWLKAAEVEKRRHRSRRHLVSA